MTIIFFCILQKISYDKAYSFYLKKEKKMKRGMKCDPGNVSVRFNHKSCQIDRIYELNAHECHNSVRGMSVRKCIGCNGRSQRQ